MKKRISRARHIFLKEGQGEVRGTFRKGGKEKELNVLSYLMRRKEEEEERATG